jgi:hypothetical protein
MRDIMTSEGDMTYSPKGRWIAMGAAFLLTAAWVWYGVAAHPSRDVLPWVGGAFILVCFALAFRAYFYLDEIQQGDRMRAWYYGSPLGMAFTGLLIMYLISEPRFLDLLAGIFHHQQPHKPMEYFIVGVLVTMLPQAVGNYLVRACMALTKRNA